MKAQDRILGVVSANCLPRVGVLTTRDKVVVLVHLQDSRCPTILRLVKISPHTRWTQGALRHGRVMWALPSVRITEWQPNSTPDRGRRVACSWFSHAWTWHE